MPRGTPIAVASTAATRTTASVSIVSGHRFSEATSRNASTVNTASPTPRTSSAAMPNTAIQSR
jgi:hypothetical protein